MWWLAHRVEELRNSGLSDNEIRVVIKDTIVSYINQNN